MKQVMNRTEILDDVKIGPLESCAGSESDHTVLTSEQLTLLARLDQYEAPWLEEKLLKEKVFSSSNQYRQVFSEFKKYVALIALFEKPLPMLSKAVDAVWHQFILFTKQYHSFCEQFLGFYLHHSPNTSFTSEGDQPTGNFTEQYQSIFGGLPELWNISESEDCKNDCSAECSGECSSECSGDCKGGN